MQGFTAIATCGEEQVPEITALYNDHECIPNETIVAEQIFKQLGTYWDSDPVFY